MDTFLENLAKSYADTHPITVADPRFSSGGANSQSGCANLLFCKFFAESCMKMKDLDPGNRPPPRSPNAPMENPGSAPVVISLFSVNYSTTQSLRH